MRMVLLVIIGALAACRSTVGPYSTPSEVSRDTTAAEKLSREAADLIDSDPSKAEAILREALTKDLFYGPAHNNLGVVFLKQDKLYEAANEFEWARKLLPDSPDPRVNLGIAMERAGRTDDAFLAYESALEVAPECVAAMQGASRISVASAPGDERLGRWLDKVALRGESVAWRDWAQVQARSYPLSRHATR